MLHELLLLTWRLVSIVPGFLAGGATLLFAYLWVACTALPKGILQSAGKDDDEEEEVREKLLKDWEAPVSSEHAEAYRCGWVYLTSEYTDGRPPIDLSILLRMKNSRRSRPSSVYFLVLKHNSLFMYENEEQVNCAGVVIIEDCKIDLYPHTLLLDEIYKKEYPLRIISPDESFFEQGSKLYLYAANASEKEDWLFALRQAANPQGEKKDETVSNFSYSPRDDPKLANAIFMERLKRYVCAPSMDKSTQWLNALAGRLFFNMFRSNDLERFFRKKFERKAASVPKPFFLGDLILKSIVAGHSLPMFSRGQLHSVTNSGELSVSVDIFYPGGFRMQVETEIKWEIPKVKKIIVPVIMSIHVRRLAGRALIRIKPPPSDRLWLGFYSPPQLDIDIEPVVSSKALTWSVIKTGILKHLHDTMAEYIVLPNMDDFNVPPVIIGDCYGGEKPFELDYIPPTLMAEARQHDLSAHGISAMRCSRRGEVNTEEKDPQTKTVEGNLFDRELLAGGHSLSDLSLDGADLSMDPLASYSSVPKQGSPNLYDEARRSDILAQERVKEKVAMTEEVERAEGGNNSTASTSTSAKPKSQSTQSSPTPNRSTKEVIMNVRRSVSTFFRTRQASLFSRDENGSHGYGNHRFVRTASSSENKAEQTD